MFAEDRPLIKQVVSIFFVSIILKLWLNSGKPNCPQMAWSITLEM